MQADSELRAWIGKHWCSYYQHAYWALQGTGTVLDGTVLATHFESEPFLIQARKNIKTVNRRRERLSLPEVLLDEKVR
jgi:hypothetical protein